MDGCTDQWLGNVIGSLKNGVYTFSERTAYEMTYKQYKRRKEALMRLTGESIAPFRWHKWT